MKKLISFVVLSLMASSVMADTFVANTAKNQRGEEVRADYGGYDATRVFSTTEHVICTGRCVLAGLLMSNGAAASTLAIYDTAVAGGNADRIKVLTNFDLSATGSAAVRVPRPVRFTTGISAKISSIAAGESVTVLYVDLDQR